MTKKASPPGPRASRVAWWFALWFGCGLAPLAPGTAGSLGALLVAWPLAAAGLPPWGFFLLAMALLYPAVRAAGAVAIETGREDPQIVVVDEVLGQWIALAGASRLNWPAFAIAFVLFRLFDMWKPWPVSTLERLPGGQGIVFDDIGAGALAALLLLASDHVRLS